MARIKDCWCYHCGHPVMDEGVSLMPEDDYDRTGAERDRCYGHACQSDAVATIDGGVLAVVEASR